MKILIAIDESKCSQAAVRSVAARPWPSDTEIRVVHVVEPPSLLLGREMTAHDPEFEAVWKALREQAKALVAKATEWLRRFRLERYAGFSRGRSKVTNHRHCKRLACRFNCAWIARAEGPVSFLDG